MIFVSRPQESQARVPPLVDSAHQRRASASTAHLQPLHLGPDHAASKSTAKCFRPRHHRAGGFRRDRREGQTSPAQAAAEVSHPLSARGEVRVRLSPDHPKTLIRLRATPDKRTFVGLPLKRRSHCGAALLDRPHDRSIRQSRNLAAIAARPTKRRCENTRVSRWQERLDFRPCLATLGKMSARTSQDRRRRDQRAEG